MANIKIGACDWALPGDGLYAPRIAAEFGLEALSLKIGLWKNNYPIAESVMQKFYLEEQDKYNIEYVAIATNDFDNICVYSPKGTEEYDIIRTIARKAVSTASALGASVIQVPGFAASAVEGGKGFDGTVEVLRLMCDLAGEKGITVASENLMLPAEFKTLFEAVDRPNYKAYYDSQNYFVFKGYDQVEVLNGLYEYMCPQIHVKDGNGFMSGSILGEGNSNYFGTIKALKEKGFEGCILLENYFDQLPLRLDDPDPYALLRRDIAVLRKSIQDW